MAFMDLVQHSWLLAGRKTTNAVRTVWEQLLKGLMCVGEGAGMDPKIVLPTMFWGFCSSQKMCIAVRCLLKIEVQSETVGQLSIPYSTQTTKIQTLAE